MGTTKPEEGRPDQFAAFLRVLAVLAFTSGVFFFAEVSGRDDTDGLSFRLDLEAVEKVWPLSGLLLTLALLFFAAGAHFYAGYEQKRKLGLDASKFLIGQLLRVAIVTIPFVLAWSQLLRLFLRSGWRSVSWAGYPLQIIGVLAVIAALMPLTARLHRLLRWWFPAGILLGLFIHDAALGTGWSYMLHVPYRLDLFFVWLLIFQVGYFYADGTLKRLPRPLFALVAIFALLLLRKEIFFQIPSRSYGEGTVWSRDALASFTHGVWLVSLALFLRPKTWVTPSRVVRIVGFFDKRILTIFLWSGTAALLVPGILQSSDVRRIWQSNLPYSNRLFWVMSSALMLAGVTALVGPLEHWYANRGESGLLIGPTNTRIALSHKAFDRIGLRAVLVLVAAAIWIGALRDPEDFSRAQFLFVLLSAVLIAWFPFARRGPWRTARRWIGISTSAGILLAITAASFWSVQVIGGGPEARAEAYAHAQLPLEVLKRFHPDFPVYTLSYLPSECGKSNLDQPNKGLVGLFVVSFHYELPNCSIDVDQMQVGTPFNPPGDCRLPISAHLAPGTMTVVIKGTGRQGTFVPEPCPEAFVTSSGAPVHRARDETNFCFPPPYGCSVFSSFYVLKGPTVLVLTAKRLPGGESLGDPEIARMVESLEQVPSQR